MTKYKTLDEAFASIDYGICSICQAKHEFPNVKCEFTNEKEGECAYCEAGVAEIHQHEQEGESDE
jgi:hypothetical protein